MKRVVFTDKDFTISFSYGFPSEDPTLEHFLSKIKPFGIQRLKSLMIEKKDKKVEDEDIRIVGHIEDKTVLLPKLDMFDEKFYNKFEFKK